MEGKRPSNFDTLAGSDSRLMELRSRISDLGQEIDVHKAKTGAALGGGLFLLLLAVGALYDVVSGRASLWRTLGITADQFHWITGGLVAAAVCLLAVAAARILRGDRQREAELDELQRELEQLIDRGKGGSPDDV